MGKTIKEHLEDTFEDLGEEKLKKFKIKLRDRKPEDDKRVVRQATIDKIKDALDLADVMVNTFTETGAVPVTIELLTTIKANNLAEELRKNTRDVAPVVPQTGRSAPSNEELFIDRDLTELIKRVHNVDPKLAPVVPQPDPSAVSNAQRFIDGNETGLIKRVHKVDPILDELRQKKVITDEDYIDVRAEKTPQASMRALLLIIKSIGPMGKYHLYEALKKSNDMLMQDLEA